MVGRRSTKGHEHTAVDKIQEHEREEDVEKLEMSGSSMAEARSPSCKV